MLKSFYKHNLTPHSYFIMAVAIAFLSLATAYFFEYVQHLKPCVLCLYQRIPFALILPIAATILLTKKESKTALVLIILLFLANFFIAGFHSGVERGLWEMTDSCSAAVPTVSVEELQKILLSESLGKCNEIPWSIVGLSMANLNLILSLVMAVVGISIMVRQAHHDGNKKHTSS